MPIFMFTDIEGSTRLWEKHPKAMGQVLARHDAILQKLIEEYGGRVIKHMGDGVFAVFEEGEPVRCALEIQKQLRDEDWGAIGALRICIALYAGDAEKRGGDYFGSVVNCTARIVSAGRGGQTLLTPEVVKASGLPAQATLQDLGFHWFKDLKEPQRILGLAHPDLRWQGFRLSACARHAPISSVRLRLKIRLCEKNTPGASCRQAFKPMPPSFFTEG